MMEKNDYQRWDIGMGGSETRHDVSLYIISKGFRSMLISICKLFLEKSCSQVNLASLASLTINVMLF